MRADNLSFVNPDVLISPLHTLQSLALEGEGEAFYLLLEKAFYGEAGALEAFHQVVTSHPSHFYRFAQFFSHPEFSEIVFKIIEHPEFDLTPLKAFIETEPALLMIVAGLALEQNHSGARELLPRLSFERSAYEKAVQEDFTYVAFLTLIAEQGFVNVQDLIIDLFDRASEETFFAFVGCAAEGSLTALQVINERATVAHLAIMVDFVRRYESQPELIAPLMQVIRDPGFCPRELWNPASQEILKEKGIDAILFNKEIEVPLTQEDLFPLRKVSGIKG